MLSTPFPASADPALEYCEREMPEIADYCVAQERAAQEWIKAGNPDPFLLFVCRKAFPESYAMQDACITIKEDYERGLGPVKPGENI